MEGSPQRRTHAKKRRSWALGCYEDNETRSLSNRMQQDNAQPSAAYTLPRKRNVELSDATKTLRSPQRRTHCQDNKFLGNRMQQDNAQPSAAYALPRKNEMLGRRMLRRHCAAHSCVRIAKLGNRMQQDNARPSAAYALPRKRNVELSDATKTLRSPQRRTHCTTAQPTTAYALPRKRIPRQSGATRQCAALSGARTATKTKCWAVGCYEDTAQPTAAYALPRKRNCWAIGCNKTVRSPQRRTHCQENKMLSCRMLRRHCAARSPYALQRNEIPRQSDATRHRAALSGVRIAKKTKCWEVGCYNVDR